MSHYPFVPASKNLPELTLKVFILGFLLAMLLAASNAYLGLKMGRTVSGSIPAAVISIAVLHWFRKRNILENNIVQTAASAGECLAAGIVFTIPALLMLGVWDQFHYFDVFFIAIIGGGLGVLFSVPLRRIMIVEKKLPYPEGLAVAEILKAPERQDSKINGIKYLLRGAIPAAIFIFLQTGCKIIGESITMWTYKFGLIFGFGFGFSPVLFAAGYIVGLGVVMDIALGNVTSWLIGIPLLSYFYPEGLSPNASEAVQTLYKEHLRFASIGAITFGGLWSLITLYRPMITAVKTAFNSLKNLKANQVERTERDIPMPFVFVIILLMTIPLFFVFYHNIQQMHLPLTPEVTLVIVIICTALAIILGFVASSIASYLVGLVGTSSLPISGLAISAIVFMGVLLIGVFGTQMVFNHPDYAPHAAAITVIFAAIICLSASLGGDNMQDLRAGYALGATPWKQQVILFLGVFAGALVISPVMNVLLNAYGIGDIIPRTGMDPEKVLLAPQASMVSVVSKGIFLGQINMLMFGIGVFIGILIAFLDYLLEKNKSSFRIPVLAFGLGMYLPMSLVVALAFGGILSYLLHRFHKNMDLNAQRRGILMAAGMIAGEALMGIALAIPFSLSPSGEDALALNMNISPLFLNVLGCAAFLYLIYLQYKNVIKG